MKLRLIKFELFRSWRRRARGNGMNVRCFRIPPQYYSRDFFSLYSRGSHSRILITVGFVKGSSSSYSRTNDGTYSYCVSSFAALSCYGKINSISNIWAELTATFEEIIRIKVIWIFWKDVRFKNLSLIKILRGWIKRLFEFNGLFDIKRLISQRN